MLKRQMLCRQMINCMKAWNYLQKISGLLLNTKIIKQAHKAMMDGEKGVGEYRKLHHIFAPVGYIERYMEGAIFRF